MTLKEFRENYLVGCFLLKSARTGKILFRSWINKNVTKYDDYKVVTVWSEIRIVELESTFGNYARPIMGIYLSGL